MYWCNHFIRPIPQPFIKYLRDIRNRKWGRVTMLELTNYAMLIACVASVSVRFRSKERGTIVKDCAKNGLSKRVGRGWGRKEGNASPPPSPPFIFWLVFHFSRGLNRESCSSVFLCSETKRKRLLRRLQCSKSQCLF